MQRKSLEGSNWPQVTAQAVKVLNAVATRFGHTFEYQYALMVPFIRQGIRCPTKP